MKKMLFMFIFSTFVINSLYADNYRSEEGKEVKVLTLSDLDSFLRYQNKIQQNIDVNNSDLRIKNILDVAGFTTSMIPWVVNAKVATGLTIATFFSNMHVNEKRVLKNYLMDGAIHMKQLADIMKRHNISRFKGDIYYLKRDGMKFIHFIEIKTFYSQYDTKRSVRKFAELCHMNVKWEHGWDHFTLVDFKGNSMDCNFERFRRWPSVTFENNTHYISKTEFMKSTFNRGVICE